MYSDSEDVQDIEPAPDHRRGRSERPGTKDAEPPCTTAHWRLAALMAAIIFVVVLMGSSAIHPPTDPAVHINLAAPSCAPLDYDYFTPYEWAYSNIPTENSTGVEAAYRRIEAVLRSIELPRPAACRACPIGAAKKPSMVCIPPLLANVSDSSAVLAMLVAARCERIEGASLERAHNTTVYAARVDQWTHTRTPGDIAATVLGMAGYDNAHTLCPGPSHSSF